jgi:hypothetical protein
MSRPLGSTAASVVACAAALWTTTADAAEFALRVSAPSGTKVAGSYSLIRDDGSQIQDRIADTGAGELRFEGRVIRLTLNITSGRGPVQAELSRDGTQVAQAMASGAGGVLTLSGGR